MTRIANAPEYLRGVLNLRGVIVPVVDMRLRFGTGEARMDEATVNIILNIRGHVIGMMVDSVSDVVTLSQSAIKPPPELGSVFSTDFNRSGRSGSAHVDFAGYRQAHEQP